MIKQISKFLKLETVLIIVIFLEVLIIGVSNHKTPQQTAGIQSIKGKSISYNFTDEIGEGSYQDLIDILKNAAPGDKLNLSIRSPGGSLKRTLEIEDAMQKTSAHISCTVKDYAASGAASVLLACDEITMLKDSVVLFHLPYVAQDGRYKTRNAEMNERFFNHLVGTYCIDSILDPVALKKLMFGYDIVLSKQYFDGNINKGCKVKGGNKINRTNLNN